MTPAHLAEVARQQNERDAAAGYCTRHVEDTAVLMRIATMMAEHQAGEGGDAVA